LKSDRFKIVQTPVYLDYNSTTPVDPQVVEAMLPWFFDKPGNAASRTHTFGWEAEEAVDESREAIASLINADPNEIVFTSGATEAINLAIRGVFEAYKRKGVQIVTIASEHKAVLDTCKSLKEKGASIIYLPVNKEGFIDLNMLEKAINHKTILISIMYANNETGLIHPVREISSLGCKHNILFLSDATQAVGKIPINVKKDGIDLMAFSAHKLYGPKGIGALYIKKKEPKIQLSPLIYGGGHEKGIRSGTLNVPAIVGFGKASEIAKEKLGNEYQKIALLRNKLENSLLEVNGTVVNGSVENRLPNTCNLSFRDVEANMLIESINKEIAIATGSACTSASPEPSRVLKAMNLPPEQIHSSVRFSLGKFTTELEIDYVADKIKEVIKTLRSTN